MPMMAVTSLVVLDPLTRASLPDSTSVPSSCSSTSRAAATNGSRCSAFGIARGGAASTCSIAGSTTVFVSIVVSPPSTPAPLLLQELLHRGQDALGLERLHHEVAGARLERLHDDLLLADRGNHRDPGARIELLDLFEGRQAVHLEHRDVKQHDVDRLGRELVHSLAAVLGLDHRVTV